MIPRTVVIVGGGIVGLCTALFCARRGMEVTVLEREAASHEGCSTGNAGLVVPSHFVPLAAPGMIRLGLKLMRDPGGAFGFARLLDPASLAWALTFWRHCRRRHVEAAAPVLAEMNLRSKALYRQLAQELPDSFGFQERGLAMACATEAVLLEEAKLMRPAAELGLKSRLLSPTELPDALGVELDAVGAVFFEDDAHLDPFAFLSAARAEIARLGGRIVPGCLVQGWEASGARVSAAITNQGPFPGDAFVAASGVWSSALLPGLRLPLLAGLGCSVTLDSPPCVPNLPLLLVEARVAVTPMGGSVRFAGTMELGPPSGAPNPARLAGLKKAAGRSMPQFAEGLKAATASWSGNRPCLPDGMPAIGRHPRLSNLVAATGHAMMGLSLGPATGMVVAELLAGEGGGMPMEMLRPDRFGQD